MSGKFQQFGYDAEKQMVYYLMRAFESDKVIRVMNDLRLEKDGVVAQIDHLIIHNFGFFIIESKSVTTEVSVNEHGKWARYFNNKPKGTQNITMAYGKYGYYFKCLDCDGNTGVIFLISF